MSDDDRHHQPECEFPAEEADANGCFPMPYLFAAKGCRITSTTCFSAVSPDPPKVVSRRRRKEGKKNVSDTPTPVTETETQTEPVEPEAEASALPPPPALPITPRALTSPQALSEHVGVSDTAISEIKQLVPASGDAGVSTVLLAAIGVAGGGAAWKFYSQHSKNKHNERMKELELQASSQQQRQDDDHTKCSVERAALEVKVVALESRLSDAERRAADAAASADKAAQAAQAASKEPPFSLDDLDGVREKIAELEKRLAEKKPSRKKP